ncbi:MAG: hypothetical protein CME62_17415 [Halobacteriovoraceae bacterium]|nr:hypothetical protein [Halobacteriovoraceae bacterium]
MVIALNAMAQDPYIPPARLLAENGKEYDFFLDYFQTTGIVNDDGEGFNLAEGSSYTLIDFGFNGRYGFASNFEGLIGARGRMIDATQTLEIDSVEDDYAFSRSGLESALVGFKYGFDENDGMRYALEGWYRYILHSNSEYKGGEPKEISLGDDTREIAIGLNFYNRTRSNNYLSGRVLYRTPGQTLSSEIFSQFEFAFVWSYVSFVLGVENVYSLETDTYSDDIENKPNVYTGPSERFNSFNRSWTAPYAQMGIALGDKWRVEGRYSQITTGQSTDLGPMISFHLVRREEKSREFARQDSQFKQYSIEGTVSKITGTRSACIIDRGLNVGLKAGMEVDFYYFDYLDGNELIAKGVVVKVGASKSLVKIKRRFSKRRVDVGTTARAGKITL